MKTMAISEEVRAMCECWARAFDLPVRRVAAIVQVESAGNRWAFRYEPSFEAWLRARIRKLWRTLGNDPYRDHPSDPEVTELVARAISWGPMQVLGQVAREEGFTGPYLTALCGEEGVRIGCKRLARLRDRYLGDIDRATEAYNAGRIGTAAGAQYLEMVRAAEATMREGEVK